VTVSQPRGPKFVTGQTNSHGRIVLTREDGTVSTPLPMLMLKGTIVDNGDGTVSIESEE
jgi:hypothetical protein